MVPNRENTTQQISRQRGNRLFAVLGDWGSSASELPRRLHQNEQGVLTLTSVFALFLFTILLIMIVNVATHLDDKISRQNAADASAYSGGVVLARGMNTISYTNHVLTDVFAITAFLREGKNRKSEQLIPEILDEWERTGQRLSNADFEKFSKLGEAILKKSARKPAGKDRRLVEAFGNVTAKAADFALPVFEYILKGDSQGGQAHSGPSSANPQGGLIPQFQRLAIQMIPALARQVTNEIAWRHGLTNRDLNNLPNAPQSQQKGRGPQSGMLWRMAGLPVGYPDESNPQLRTLPVVDPSPMGDDFQAVPNGSQYFEQARLERQELAKHYLEMWTRDKLKLFDDEAQMSRFSHLWRIFTCAELEVLLEKEYPQTNLPMMIRLPDTGVDWNALSRAGNANDINRNLNRDFQFLCVVYRNHQQETGPGLFKNPLAKHSDAIAFTQISLFLPRPRRYLSQGGGSPATNLGGTFGLSSGSGGPSPPPPGNISPEQEQWPNENWPTHWDLLNQNWTVKIVPATATAIPTLLQTPPGGGNVRLPNLGNVRVEQLNRIDTH